jgi:predicted aminopeptidase
VNVEAKAQQHQPYDVVVESVGMNWEHAGPLFDRYSVNLTGRLDRRWAGCYNALASTEEYARFRLDPGAANVSFTCRSTDGPVQVMKVLKKLEALVESVNRKASQDVLSERETHASAPQAAAKPVRLSLAERFGFSRGSER